MKQQATLKNLVELVDRIEQDDQQLDSTLRRRDRPIGRELAHLQASPMAQLSAWLERITETQSGSSGSRFSSALRIGVLLLVCLGLLCGSLTAAAVFYYDGSHPVNIINVLAVFVGFQALLLFFTLLTLLPDRLLRYLPLLPALKETFSLFSPGRLLKLFSRFLPASYRQAAATFSGRTVAHRSLYGRVEKWLILRSGQAFGVAFNLGALGGCLYLVIFSDLAFGWSTTLQTEAWQLKALTDWLAWPWAWLLPQTQPSLELIETSRYFRFQTGTLPGMVGSGPALLGTWWPFLILCLLVYGLVPRLVTLTIASARLQRACNYTLLHLPGVQTILDRLNAHLVETGSDHPETSCDTPLASSARNRFSGDFRGQPVSIIDWGGTGLEHAGLAVWLGSVWKGHLESVSEAGGSHSINHDQQVLQTLSVASQGPVVLLVKSWEPPMTEIMDFLKELRQVLKENRPIAVVPIGIGSTVTPLPPVGEMADVWATMVDQLGDPWTFVAPPQPREVNG